MPIMYQLFIYSHIYIYCATPKSGAPESSTDFVHRAHLAGTATPTKLIIVEQIQKGQKRFAANLGGLYRLGDAKQPRMLKPIAFVAIDDVGMVRLKPHQLTNSVLAHVLVKAALAKVASVQQNPDPPKWTIALYVLHQCRNQGTS